MHRLLRPILGVVSIGTVLVALTFIPVAALATESQETQLAAKLYGDLKKIATAVDGFRKKHKSAPASVEALAKGGFLKEVPVIGEELGGGSYTIDLNYANMDGKGEGDAAIYSGENIPGPVCAEFNRRYAAPPLNDGTVYDYRAAGSKYPGEIHGQQVKVYAIKWESDREVCEINWVFEYK